MRWGTGLIGSVCLIVHIAGCQLGSAQPLVTSKPPDPAHTFSAWHGHDGYFLHVPEACSAGTCGLIVDFHGWSMTPDEEDLQTNLRALTKKDVIENGIAFAVLQPLASGTPPSWAAADVDKLRDDVFRVQRELGVPRELLVVGGYSMGAGVAAKLACAQPDSFGALFMISGGADVLSDCLAEKPAETTNMLPPSLLLYGQGDKFMAKGSVARLLTLMKQRDVRVAVESSASITRHELDGTGIRATLVRHGTRNRLVGAHCVPGSRGRLKCDATPYDTGREILEFVGRSFAESLGTH